MKAPSPYRYLSCLQFLADWFSWWQAEKSTHSHRRFAKIAKVATGTLSNVLQDHRRPSEEMLLAFNEVIQLPPDELEFLQKLNQLAGVSTLAERSELLGWIFGHSGFQQVRQLDGTLCDFFSRWYTLAIREMSLLPDFQDDPSWILQHLAFQVGEGEIRRALEELELLGLLRRRPDGRLEPTEVRMQTEHQALGAMAYHREMLSLGLQALDLPAEQRFLASVTLHVPRGGLDLLGREVMRFAHHLANTCDEPSLEHQEIYAVNIQVLPMVRRRVAAEPPQATDEKEQG